MSVPPKVITHRVKDGQTGEWIDFFETPTPFVFLFYIYGMERHLKLTLPIGGVVRLDLTPREVTP